MSSQLTLPKLRQRATDVGNGNISNCCHDTKKHHTAGGFRWRYADPSNGKSADSNTNHSAAYVSHCGKRVIHPLIIDHMPVKKKERNEEDPMSSNGVWV